MAQHIIENRFTGGMNSDIDPQLSDGTTYRDAENMMLSYDGSELSIKGIPVGEMLKRVTVTAPETNNNIIKAVEAQLTTYDSSNEVSGSEFAIFYVEKYENAGSYYIRVGAIKQDLSIVTVFNSVVDLTTVEFNELQPDFLLFREEPYDILFISDGINPVYRVPLIDGTLSSFPFPLNAEISTLGGRTSVFPQYGIETWTINDAVGGTLLTGAYQFTGKFVNNILGFETPLMPLTEDVYIFNGDKGSGVTGKGTDKAIELRINNSTSSVFGSLFNNYTHFQLYSIDKVLGQESYTEASVRDLYEITSTDKTNGYIHLTIKSNDFKSTIDVANIVVPKAPIKSLQSIEVSDNIMFGSNVEYFEFKEGASGYPSVEAGSLVQSEEWHPQEDGINASRVGFFRGEAYRFGVVYYDKFGNKSQVFPLDMSSVTGNYSSSTDMRFPNRGNGASQMDLLTNENINKIKIRLGIENHPSNAVGFVIVRAKRKKNIIFQSPRISLVPIEQQQAKGNYPVLDSNNNSINTQPPTGDSFCIEQNMFIPGNFGYERATGANGNDIDLSGFPTGNSFVFDPLWMYENKTQSLTGKVIRFADASLNRGRFTYNVGDTGDSAGSKIAGSFYSHHDDYWYHANSTPIGTSFNGGFCFHVPGGELYGQKVTSFINTSYGQEKTITGDGFYYGGFDELQPERAKEGSSPRGIKGTIITEGSRIVRSDYWAANGGTIGGNSIDTTRYNGAVSTPNQWFRTLAGGSNTEHSSVTEIVNITNDLDDFRYGELDNDLEYVSTGTYRFFTEAEITSIKAGNATPTGLINVYGGDCFIQRHAFNIGKQSYARTDIADSLTVSSGKWGKAYDAKTPAGKDVDRLIGIAMASSIITVFLESEYQGEMASTGSFVESDIPADPTGEERYLFVERLESGLADLPYELSLDLKADRQIEIFSVKNEDLVSNNKFSSRVVFSNRKIYNSSIKGFNRFNILDFYDFQGSDGKANKLKVFRDNLYLFQDKAVTYLPIGKGVMETADGIAVSLSSGEVINRPVKISNHHGIINKWELAETRDSLIFTDYGSKAAVEFDGNTFVEISKKGYDGKFINRIRTSLVNFSSDFIRTGKIAYDSARDEVIFYYGISASGQFPSTDTPPIVYSKKYGVWTTRIERGGTIPISYIIDIKRIDSEDLTGLNGTNMYSFNMNGFSTAWELHNTYNVNSDFLGISPSQMVLFTTAPENGNMFTFDEMYYSPSTSSGNTASSIQVSVVAGQNSDGTAVLTNSNEREGFIYYREIRSASDDRRIRGQYTKTTVRFPNLSDTGMSKFMTKFRTSKKEANITSKNAI